MAREQLDPYDVLGVGRHASGDDVTRAYRRAVRATHPDGGSAASADGFHEVTRAYETLRDPQRRAAYDRAHPQRPPVVSTGPHIVLGDSRGLNAGRRRLFIEVKETNDH